MNKVTTSAQKTVAQSKRETLQALIDHIGQREGVTFEQSHNQDIYEAAMVGGSKLCVAAFDKPAGRTLAMVDHQNIDETERVKWQSHWRTTVDELFESKGN